MILSVSLLIVGVVSPESSAELATVEKGATTVEIVSIIVGIASVIALFAGPVIAVALSVRLSHSTWAKAEAKTEIRNEKLWVLRVLMASRHSVITDTMTQAHNMIDFAFRDTATVTEAWHKYYEMLYGEQYNNAEGFKLREKQRMAMLHAMVVALGCDEGLSQWDVDRVYRPKGLFDDEMTRQSINAELLRILKTTRAFATLPIEEPQPKPLPEKPQAAEPPAAADAL